MCRSILSICYILLSKIALQIWHDHQFSQRNGITERRVGVGLGGDIEVGVWVDKIWKRWSRQYKGVFIK